MKHRDIISKTRPGPALEAAKRRALVVLKQKKLYEGQRDRLYNQQFSVDSVSDTMASMQDNVRVVQAMQASATDMKKMMKTHKELNVDHVWKTMDSMQDLQADFEEIQDAMASFSPPVDMDEDELMGELDALDAQLLTEGPSTTGGVPAYLQELETLPEAPAGQAAVYPNAPPSQTPNGPPMLDDFGLPAVAQRT